MNTHVDTIVQDLYALDPSLRERDVEIRGIITAFLDVKPSVEVNPNFLAALRAQLVKQAPWTAPVPSPFAWWLFRVAPIGVAAVLLTITVPGFLPQYEKPSASLPPVETFEAVDTAPMMFSIPSSAKRTADVDIAPPQNTQLEERANDAGVLDTFAVSEQQPGDLVVIEYVSLVAPSFIVIQKNSEGVLGAVIGASTLLRGGLAERIDVPLTQSLESGETYFAVLYRDQGDGIFTEGIDTPVYDQTSGIPMSILFSVTK